MLGKRHCLMVNKILAVAEQYVNCAAVIIITCFFGLSSRLIYLSRWAKSVRLAGIDPFNRKIDVHRLFKNMNRKQIK